MSIKYGHKLVNKEVSLVTEKTIDPFWRDTVPPDISYVIK